MTTDNTFEEYLISKKIDSNLFKTSEPGVWETWKKEFAEMHPNSFTVQKLNLINPIRRKYQLATIPEEKKPGVVPSNTAPAQAPAVKAGRPLIRPKLD